MNTQSNFLKYCLLVCGGLIVILLLIIVSKMGGGSSGLEQARFRSAIQSVLNQDATTGSGATSVADVVARMRGMTRLGARMISELLTSATPKRGRRWHCWKNKP